MKITEKLSKIIATVAITAGIVLTVTVPAFAAGKHTVTFMYGTKTYQTTVDDGCDVIPPSDTYVPGYVFTGWAGSIKNIKSDMIIMGSYVQVPQQVLQAQAAAAAQQAQIQVAPVTVPDYTVGYNVQFVDGLTNEVVWNQRVSAGADATPPEIPHHDGYHFDRFDGSFTKVTSDRRITILYDHDFYDYDWDDDYNDLMLRLIIADQLGLLD